MTDLERITAELAEVQDALLALPADAFAERYGLQRRRDALRAAAARYRSDFDERRNTRELLAELRALEAAIAARTARTADFTMLSGPGGTGGAPAAVSGEMTEAVLAARGTARRDLAPLVARRAVIERVLAERGIEPATGRPKGAGAAVEEPRPDLSAG